MVDDIQEEWKPVVGFEGRYEVSSNGRVRSLRGNGNWNAGIKSQILRKRDGYYQVTLFNGLKHGAVMVHRIVAQAFLGPRPPGAQVNHTD